MSTWKLFRGNFEDYIVSAAQLKPFTVIFYNSGNISKAIKKKKKTSVSRKSKVVSCVNLVEAF